MQIPILGWGLQVPGGPVNYRGPKKNPGATLSGGEISRTLETGNSWARGTSWYQVDRQGGGQVSTIV